MSARAGAAAVCALLLAGAGTALFAQEAARDGQAPGVKTEPTPIVLSVDQTISRALANQPLIQQAEAAVEAARARVGEANSAYYPFVNGTAAYNRLSDQSFSIASVLPPGISVSQAGQYAPLLEAPFSLVPVNTWDFNVGLNQVIFQFGKRGIQVKLAENGVSAAQIGVEQIKTSLALQAAQGFYTVLFLRQQMAALDSQLANLNEHLGAVHIRMQTGSATRYDELSTEVRITALQSQRIDAESMLNRQTIGLKQLLGLDVADKLDLQGDFVPGTETLQDDQAQLSVALARRPEVRQAAEGERAAELGRQLASKGALPTVAGHASIGYKNGILPDINVPAFNWVAGVQVSVPIFQGFLIAHQGEEADGKLLAARENSLAVRRNVTTQVLQALQDVETARRQVQSAQSQLEQAQQMLDVVKIQYDLGMLTNLEYLDAQASLERAQLAGIQAQYREVLSEYSLMQATGSPIWVSAASSSGTAVAGGH